MRLLLGLTLSVIATGMVSDVSDTIAAGAQGADRIEVTARSRSVQPGELEVLTIAPSSRTERLIVRAFEREVAPFAMPGPSSAIPAWEALIGIDLDVKDGTCPVTIDADDGRMNVRLPFNVIWKKDNASPLLQKFLAQVQGGRN